MCDADSPDSQPARGNWELQSGSPKSGVNIVSRYVSTCECLYRWSMIERVRDSGELGEEKWRVLEVTESVIFAEVLVVFVGDE